MTGLLRDDGRRRKPAAIAGFVVIQTLAAVFFIGDALADLSEEPLAPHGQIEAFVALALVLGVLFGGWQLRLTLQRMRAQQRALDTARGALSDVVETQFGAWGLTPAERDVGLLALKGLDVADIARIRGAAPGTVRAQLTKVYAKAGVSGRAQFGAWFVEDLLDHGLRTDQTPAA
jgi:DNA-binding CsgD family transcriptional regulator